METSNDYTKEEDIMMGELHEVRHTIINKILTEGAKSINDDAKSFYNDWKKNRNKVSQR